MKKRILYMAMMAAAFTSCQDNTTETEYPHDASLDIKVGSIDCGSADAVVVENITKSATTRASQKAEEVEWLKVPLRNGIDVRYYLRSDENKNTSTAVLKLLPETNQVAGDSTKYSFNYKDENGQETQKPAQWKGNAGHVFHGFYIPEGISNGEIGNQSKSEISNEPNAESYYDKLWRYLSMPPNHEIMATVGYVRLPFRHRLSRVLAYVLIDPDLKTSIKDNIISFENVKVLQKVEGTTPKWTTARKVVPHSMGTSGSVNKKLEQTDENFLVFRNTTSNTFVYPTDDAWANVKAAYDNNKENSGYEEINYGKVSCFDIIVRPTYTSSALVMYDEDMSSEMTAAKYAAETNSIDCQSVDYNYTFTGTYAGMGDSGSADTDPYTLCDGNKWLHFHSLSPMRHYLTIELRNVSSPSPASMRSIMLSIVGDEDTTGIVKLYDEERKSSETYDLSGRRLPAGSKHRGLIIENGKVTFKK